MSNEQKILIVSICNTIIDKADPEKEQYDGISIGVDESGNFVAECGGDILEDEKDITEHLQWVFDVLCNEI